MSETPEHSDDIALAGEYVLRLLPRAEREAFETRLAAEPGLREMVIAWSEDLARMTESLPPVAPPAHLYQRIEDRLFGKTVPGGLGWLRGWLYGGLVAAGVALAVVILGTDVLKRPGMPADPAYVAEIAAEDRSLVLRAAYEAESGRLLVEREQGAARAGRVIELWLIEGGNAPVSLGVLPEDGIAVIALAPGQQDRLAGAVLAVSDEPPGGSPTGAPTGDVLGVGELTGT